MPKQKSASVPKPVIEPYPKKSTNQNSECQGEQVDDVSTPDIPNKQAKEKDVSLVEYSCVSCGKDVEDNGIECQWC